MSLHSSILLNQYACSRNILHQIVCALFHNLYLQSISGGKSFAEVLLSNARGDLNTSDNAVRATSLLKV